MRALLFAAILGAGLWILTEILEMASATGSTTWSLWLTTLWHPIIAIGFWGLHKRQSLQRNLLSLVATLMLVISFIAFAPVSLMMLNSPIDTFSEFMQQNPVYTVFGLLNIIGYILFSVSIIRTRFYPSWMGFVLLLAVLITIMQNFGELAEIWQHVAFMAISLMIIFMALFGLQSQSEE